MAAAVSETGAAFRQALPCHIFQPASAEAAADGLACGRPLALAQTASLSLMITVPSVGA